MRIGVTYDLRADYLAMGYGEEETAEFDSRDHHRRALRARLPASATSPAASAA